MKKTLATSIIIASAAVSAHAAVIYGQAFTGGTATVLNGSAVQTGTGNWIAGSSFQQNGIIDGSTTPRTSALLPFTITEGEIYELTATVTVTGLSNHFLGLGFANNIAFIGGDTQNDGNNFRLAATEASGILAGYAWMFTAPGTGQAVSAFDGDGVNNLASTANISVAAPTLKIILDASDSVNWTTKYYYDGALVASSSQAKAFFSTVDSVGLTVGNAGGSFSNFQLQTIPEPATASFLGVMGAALLIRRRRLMN